MTKANQSAVSPEQVFREYERGIAYKRAMGDHGMYEQNRINERFFSGDQWYGANCGDNRPLVRYNVIRRIGDYKMAVIAAAPAAVQFSAEGVPNTLEMRERIAARRQLWRSGVTPEEPLSAEEEAQAVAAALGEYHDTTARRLRLDMLGSKALRNAYITGTGVLYTYWDASQKTGLYADTSHRCPIRGDIACEVLEIENVYCGDPRVEELQQQPYVLVAQRMPAEQVARQAKSGGCRDWGSVRPDEDADDGHTTVLTRFWKEWDDSGEALVWAVQVCRGVTVRKPWCTGLRLYPLSVFRWDEKRCRAYGESEIPYLIPNQIAINRTVSAGVWAVMAMGMPIMLVNGDVVTQPVTNDPGQVIPVYGSGDEVKDAVRYVDPPAFSAQFDANVQHLISDTMTQAGVNTTLLGDVKPDNTSAILAVREASLMPLQLIRNRYFTFLEETARIWTEFWLTMYGDRALKIEQPDGVWYLPFHADRYRDLLLNIRVEAGESGRFSEVRTAETLDNLYRNGVINARQYLSRLPQGYVPKLDALLREIG